MAWPATLIWAESFCRFTDAHSWQRARVEASLYSHRRISTTSLATKQSTTKIFGIVSIGSTRIWNWAISSPLEFARPPLRSKLTRFLSLTHRLEPSSDSPCSGTWAPEVRHRLLPAFLPTLTTTALFQFPATRRSRLTTTSLPRWTGGDVRNPVRTMFPSL